LVRAVNLLGLDIVRALVLTVGIFAHSTTKPLGGISVDSIYFHSLKVGAGAKRLGKILGLDNHGCDDALMAGMMHDIGRLIALTYLRGELKNAMKLVNQYGITLHQAEERVMTVSHAEVGAHLLSIWGLPDSIVEAVAFHHQPGRSVNNVSNALTAVHLANAFVQENADRGVALSLVDNEYVARLGLTARLDELREICVIE
jgi:putative nucleotidyltransferase with HDIG domain